MTATNSVANQSLDDSLDDSDIARDTRRQESHVGGRAIVICEQSA
jgi:hypothetical protein